MITLARRYPGAQPFNEGQAQLFFGRSQASLDLHRLVKQENLVVLHAKSGIGKSSLLKAGLLPLLRQNKRLYPIEIRIGTSGAKDHIAPVLTTKLTIDSKDVGSQPSSFIEKIIPEDKSLWRSLKELQVSLTSDHPEEGDQIGIILLFDQFEELFSYPAKQQIDFRRQLAECLNSKLPQRYWDVLSLYEGRELPISKKDKKTLIHPIKIHVVVAIREDRIHLLGSLSDYLPTISKNWFELKPLNEEETSAAITLPAKMEGKFATEEFDFSIPAKNAIINYLSTGKDGIESTQLQVICDAIDRKVAKMQVSLVSEEFLGDLEEITTNYYWEKLNEITDDDQRKIARKIIEDELIFEEAERRLSLFGGQIEGLGLKKETLTQLINGYLLRAEPDLRGGYNYEISHDSLVKSIIESKRERHKEEEGLLKAKEEKIRKEELGKIKEERRKARRLNLFLATALLVAIGAIGISIWQYTLAKKSEQEAITKTIIAEQSLEALSIEEEKAKEALAQFKQEQADRISSEIDDIVSRALTLRDGDYSSSMVWKNMLLDAKKILEEFNDNELLSTKRETIEKLLK